MARRTPAKGNSSQKLCPVNAGLAAHLRFEIIGGRKLWEQEMGPFVDGRIRKSTKRKKVSQQGLCSHLNTIGLDRFFSQRNIGFYRILADKSTNAAKRRKILRLLAEDEINFKLELKRSTSEINKRASRVVAEETTPAAK